MKRKLRLQLIIGLVLALAVTSGLYAFTYLSATATMGVTVAGAEIATAELSAAQPPWGSILTPVAAGTETLRPNAAGTYSQADPVGEVSNWECVDEEVADDDSTYVETSGGATSIPVFVYVTKIMIRIKMANKNTVISRSHLAAPALSLALRTAVCSISGLTDLAAAAFVAYKGLPKVTDK